MPMAEKLLLGARFAYRKDFISPLLGPGARKAKKRLEDKIESGEYKFEKNECFCGASEGLVLSETDRYGNYYSLTACRQCGILRADPRLSRDSYLEFYANDYRSMYGDDDADKEALYKFRLRQADEAYGFILRRVPLPEQSVVFDIGCNMGTMLLPFHRRGHFVAGVDYNKGYIDFGKSKHGLNIFCGGIERLKGAGEKADLVILNHVFEHFIDIDSELNGIRHIMKPEGLLFISLPGTLWWIKHRCNSDIMGLLQNAHIWQLSLSSLNYICECLGFSPVYGDEQVRAIYKVSGSFRDRKELPAEEYAKVLAHLTKTERAFARRLSLLKFIKSAGIHRILKKNA